MNKTLWNLIINKIQTTNNNNIKWPDQSLHIALLASECDRGTRLSLF